MYLNTPEMYEIDFDKSGFEWLIKDDKAHSITAFKRISKSGSYLICLNNFSPYREPDYVIGVDEPGCYQVIFSSDDTAFGGSGEEFTLMYSSIMNKDGKSNAIRINIPANSSLLIKKVEKNERFYDRG